MGSRMRSNGLDPPMEPLQIIAWGLKVAFPVYMFTIINPVMADQWATMNTYCFAGLVFVTIMSCVSCTLSNPLDPKVRKKLNPNEKEKKKEKHHNCSKSEDPDSLPYCPFCEVVVRPKSKHCRICDKCVGGFDHHCRWLNNCIGEENYKIFFLYVVSVFFTSLWVLLVSLAVLIGVSQHSTMALGFIPLKPVSQALPALGKTGFTVITGFFIFMSFLVTMLIGQLLFFHIYLIHRKITTYDFIIQQRNNKENTTDPRTKRTFKCTPWKFVTNLRRCLKLGIRRNPATAPSSTDSPTHSRSPPPEVIIETSEQQPPKNPLAATTTASELELRITTVIKDDAVSLAPPQSGRSKHQDISDSHNLHETSSNSHKQEECKDRSNESTIGDAEPHTLAQEEPIGITQTREVDSKANTEQNVDVGMTSNPTEKPVSSNETPTSRPSNRKLHSEDASTPPPAQRAKRAPLRPKTNGSIPENPLSPDLKSSKRNLQRPAAKKLPPLNIPGKIPSSPVRDGTISDPPNTEPSTSATRHIDNPKHTPQRKSTLLEPQEGTPTSGRNSRPSKGSRAIPTRRTSPSTEMVQKNGAVRQSTGRDVSENASHRPAELHEPSSKNSFTTPKPSNMGDEIISDDENSSNQEPDFLGCASQSTEVDEPHYREGHGSHQGDVV